MKNFRKSLALLLALCLVAFTAAAALAEATDATESPATEAPTEVTQAVPAAVPALNDTDVLARVGGEDVTWAQVLPYYDSLISYYGEPDATMIDTYRAFALETAVVMTLSRQTAAANGLDQYTEEEKAAIVAQADADWQAAQDSYVQSNGGLTETSTDAEKAAAYEAAVAYFANMGYDQERLRNDYLERNTYDRVTSFVTKDVTVSDEDVQVRYESKVQNDQQIYENDLDAYEYQIMLYNNQYATEKPWYHPAGYRYVKHILLPVDAALMTQYTDLQARLEEQMDAEEEAAATEAPAADAAATEAAPTDAAATQAAAEPTAAPVSNADVDAVKGEILASLQEKTTEIYDKIAAGEDFDALIAQYGVNADGTASDPGMTSGNFPNGYEVSMASTSFVPEFVEAAFSVDNVGDVSAPYISNYGVHIVKYMADVPAGPVELTDALKTTLRESIITELNDAALDAWQKGASVEYTGLVPSMETLQGAAEDTAQE